MQNTMDDIAISYITRLSAKSENINL